MQEHIELLKKLVMGIRSQACAQAAEPRSVISFCLGFSQNKIKSPFIENQIPDLFEEFGFYTNMADHQFILSCPI